MQVVLCAEDALRLYARGGIAVVPLSQTIGAEIRGVDLRQALDPATWTAIHRAWLDHSVLLFRDQQLSDAELVRFSRHFGPLDHGPRMGWQRDDEGTLPEIFVISNVVEHGRPIGYLGDGELDWHTDMSHAAIPSKASTLYALEIPADGSGRTGFMNMYQVLEALPDALRRQIADRCMKHDATHTIEGVLRQGFRPEDGEDIVTAPGPVHPLVRTHRETGRQALYLGRQWNGSWRSGYVLGLSRQASEALQDTLWNIVRAEQFVWYQQWRVGDYLLWDNRCVMHRREPFPPGMRRVMHRTQIRDTL
jgi:taurine dioxygenase